MTETKGEAEAVISSYPEVAWQRRAALIELRGANGFLSRHSGNFVLRKLRDNFQRLRPVDAKLSAHEVAQFVNGVEVFDDDLRHFHFYLKFGFDEGDQFHRAH